MVRVRVRVMVRANLLPLALTQALILTPGFARRATELWRKAAPLEADMLHLGLFRHLAMALKHAC